MLNETASELSVRLTEASRRKFWNVYTHIDWPEAVHIGQDWFMSPEFISIYGTQIWDELDETQQKRLSFYELVNFFSFTLHGERPLVQGLSDQLYAKRDYRETEYMHHFLDEENKHMVMFGMFCQRYAGKVYKEKKINLPQQYAKGEDEVRFFIKALVVEELGDIYNLKMMRDTRIHPVAKRINYIHHMDEARHIAFGRLLLAEVFKKHSAAWSDESLQNFRAWVPAYLKSSWGDFYNPAMYQDAGLADGYKVRKFALESPVCRAMREKISSRLVDYFVEINILLERPEL